MPSLTDRLLPVVRPYGRRIQRRLDGWLAALAERESPGSASRAAAGVLAKARAGLVYNLEGRAGRLQYWHGAEVSGGQPLRAAYLGDAQGYKVASPEYLRHILLQPEGQAVQEPPSNSAFPMRRVRSAAEEAAKAAGLVIVEGSDLLRWQPDRGVWGWLPTWVRMVVTFRPGQTWDEIQAAMRKHRDNIRRAQTGGFTFAVSRRPEDFEFFYHRMHLPMLNERHGEYGVADKKETLAGQFRQGLLFFVMHDGRPVAGGLRYLRGRSVYGLASGVLDGDPAWNRQGAVAFLYLESIRWCFEHGYRRYDLGGVRPFASDGLYRFKYRWGARPERDLWLGRSWLFWAPSGSPAALDWLRAHPPAPVPGLWGGPGFSPPQD